MLFLSLFTLLNPTALLEIVASRGCQRIVQLPKGHRLLLDAVAYPEVVFVTTVTVHPLESHSFVRDFCISEMLENCSASERPSSSVGGCFLS